MRIVTGKEMSAIDAKAIAEGMPAAALMESAGVSVATAAEDMLQNVMGKRVHILCGTGNNGGDGFVVARRLSNAGARVRVSVVGSLEKLRGESAQFCDVYKKMGGQLSEVRQVNERFALTLGISDLIVDALLGTGSKGAPRSPYDAVIRAINEVHRPVLSVDIPSGVEADTGRVPGVAVRASRTVTFGLPKLGLLLHPGASFAGALSVAKIGFPQYCLDWQDTGWPMRQWLLPELVQEWARRRATNTHKGDYGRVMVVAGSTGMVGAGYLATEAALRGGAGLATWAGPTSLWPTMAAKVTAATTLGLPEVEAGVLGEAAVSPVNSMLPQFDALAIGPGLGRHESTQVFVRSVCRQAPVPTVIDADGLHALAAAPDGITGKTRKADWVLTPHPGEAAALLDCTVAEIEGDRIAAATAIAKKFSSVTVLKGVPTIVSAPNGEHLYLNSTGNPGMATGGCGDVLTGLIAGLIAQGLAPFQAAAAGVYLHGRAGDLAAQEKGQAGLLAPDLAEALPQAIVVTFEKHGGALV